MAGNDEDLVSQITVSGGNEASKEIEDFANRGAQAFDKLGASVDKASGKGAADMSKFSRATNEAADAAAKLGKQQIDPGGHSARSLKDLESNTRSFVGSLRQTTQAVGRFASRLALVGTAAQAAAIGFVEGARRIAAQATPVTNALEKQTNAQIESNNSQLSAEQAEIQHESTLRQLNGQLQRGEITYTEYRKAIVAANRGFEEQQRVARQVENATARTREENERLKKSLADQTANQKLIDTFGGPLAGALVSFGKQVEQTRQGFLQAFGPSLGAAVDVIGTSLSRNSVAINTFFTNMGAKFTTFISQNGPAIEKALGNIARIAGSVFEGLINAAPGLIDIFNNQLVPAFEKLQTTLNNIADGINKVFGTKLTGGAVALSIVILQLTGAFRLFFALLRSGIFLFQILRGLLGGPLLLILTLVAIALANVDWKAFGERAKQAANTINGAYLSVKDRVIEIFTGIRDFVVGVWEGIKSAATVVGTFLTGMFTTTIEAIKTAWNSVLGFFTTLWDGIKGLFQSGADFLSGVWGTILEFFTKLWDNIKGLFQSGVDTISGLWGAVRDAIVNAFTSAVNTVKGLFQQLLASAKAFLQPIIDLLKKIASLSGSTDTSGGGASVAAARGGHIRGPGTSTSDSILARLSNSEFVMRAKAVAKYGVGFMNAINSGRFKIPEFAFGGFIAPSPVRSMAFAGGGEVRARGSALQPLNLSIDGSTFEGLLMPEEVGSKLTKFAVSRQNRSAGRKPAWVGNRRN